MVAETVPRATPLDVSRARTDYLLGKAPLSSLADTYGINENVLKARSASEKWGELRERYARRDDVIKLIDQIDALDQRISDCDIDKDFDPLFRAKQRAMQMLWRLTGTPKEPIGKLTRGADPAKAAILAKLGKPGKQSKRVVESQVVTEPSVNYYNYEDC
jgi:hypothetical protein